MDEVPDLPPPWQQYPRQPPWWGGWRQGESETWLHRQWLPFWRALDPVQRSQYLTRWPPPDEDWWEYLTVFWR